MEVEVRQVEVELIAVLKLSNRKVMQKLAVGKRLSLVRSLKLVHRRFELKSSLAYKECKSFLNS